MTAEGRLARGKANVDSGKFLKSPETLEYLATVKTEKPKEAKKDAKSNK